MIELVLFDLDGTLVDHRRAVLETITQIIGDAPSARKQRELVETWWRLERSHMQRYLAGECSFAEQRRRRLREFLPLLGEEVPEDQGLDAWYAYRYGPLYEAAWSCYADVVPCLDALAGLEKPSRLAVLTNGDPDQQRAKLARFGLLERFEAVLTPSQLGTAKPDPATFTASCAYLGVDPRSVISVGDWLEGDVIAATEAGLCAAWIDRGVKPFTGDRPDSARTVAADLALHRLENLGELTMVIDCRCRRPRTP